MPDITDTDLTSLVTDSWIATLVSIAVSVACIVACVYLAKRKGHDLAKACTSGCVFGPFAVIYYLIAGESKGKPLGEVNNRPREDAFVEAVLASHAQAAADQSPKTQAPPPPAPPPAPIPVAPRPPLRCQYCGNVNPGEAQWCLGCGMNVHYDPGAPVILDTAALQSASAQRTRSWMLLALGVAVVVAALILALRPWA